jgi:hypothetical protein
VLPVLPDRHRALRGLSTTAARPVAEDVGLAPTGADPTAETPNLGIPKHSVFAVDRRERIYRALADLADVFAALTLHRVSPLGITWASPKRKCPATIGNTIPHKGLKYSEF